MFPTLLLPYAALWRSTVELRPPSVYTVSGRQEEMLISCETRQIMRRRLPVRFTAAAVIVAIVIAFAVLQLRTTLLMQVARYLVIEDPLQNSDAIFLLNGDFNRRPFHASELYRNGFARRIIIARAEDSPSVKLGVTQNTTDLSVQTLKKLGVPAGAIIELRPPGGVTSTYDEATALREYVVRSKPLNIILVTSEFHSRRASWTFHHVLDGTASRLMLSPVSDSKYTVTNWWRQEDGLIACQNEYLKLFFYRLHYGL
jgi:uncharacterized SAM-binding protein YcdF (DUF218 family)